ncbi:Rrf2 family transcriptional regulator [Polynucleobacter sp. MWH-Braz-FAM2G]|uniref:RrF2 family transcriptional regulator n=1 Tax=Polynucleobacter sp. MWH-Braz-FAM2G TaxID=1855883 RepID=UPI001BFCE40A|nr:Rrf2 family transcriptional regulator [Polynucleobacter sp. MWH-Braz-FAM2G]QWD90401.1 Rrf2 family transcriptional regulator [Polynucleobacter sp. MWH-Braz-FAM2G]
MEVTRAVKVALNTLVDIACHSINGNLVPAPEIAKRLHLSVSRIELLLRPLRDSGLVIGVKGRTGGYQLSKDPRIIMIKDIVLAMNAIKKRKVEVSDIAKELYQSLESYMTNYVSQTTVASAIKDCIPSFSDIRTAPERTTSLSRQNSENSKQVKLAKGETQKVVKTAFKKVDEVPRGPNSVFSFADYLNQVTSSN